MTIKELQDKANFIRDEIIRIACKNKAGHIAPSLSTVDILVALYYEIMPFFKCQALREKIKQEHGLDFILTGKDWEERDRLVLSKGHGCYALYTILADLGIIPKDQWENFNTPLSELHGCVEYKSEWGLEASTGSLGHGLPIAVGMAYAAKLQGKKYNVYCIVGDGEMQEGSNWEAIQFIVQHNLDNIHVIVDANRLRALDETPKIYDACFYDAYCNGHDISLLVHAINKRNRFIRASTIKGCGLKCMENVVKFHYRVPTDEELAMGRTYKCK